MTTCTLLYTLLRTTLVLTFCGGIGFLVLRKWEHQLPKLSRLLWVAVLLTGWFWLQPVIQIPVSTPNEPLVERYSAQLAGPAGNPEVSLRYTSGSLEFAQSAEYHTLPPGGRQPTYSETSTAQERGGASPPVTTYIFALWLAGMGITIFLAATGYIRILLSLRNTALAEDALAQPWRKLLTEHGIDSRTVPMVLTENLGPALVRTPLGYRLAVPSELWSELSETGRQGILKHELAHFRRRDVWKSFFVRILALPHWFNPVAHYAANRFDELAEQLCDRESFSGKREEISEFARILLLLHENAPTHFVARQSIFGRNLKHRVASLLENPLPDERTFIMRKILLVLGTAAILFAALFRVEFVAVSQTASEVAKEPEALAPGLQTDTVELRLTVTEVTDNEKRPLPGAQVELIYGADSLYSLQFETDANGIGITNIPVAAANAETQGRVIGKEKGMTSGFSLRQILPDWNPSKPLEMNAEVWKRTRVLTGTVIDSDDKPVAGALVGDPFEVAFAQTDEKGHFEYYLFDRPIESLFAFKEGVGGVAISPDYEDPADRWKAMNPEGIEEWRKREKHNNGPFTLKLTKGAPITIRVVNHEGNPVEGALVAPIRFLTDYRYTKEIRSWNAWNLCRHWGKRTDANGMVRFDSIPTEGYDMVTFDAFGDDPRFVKESKSKQFGKGSAIWRLRENNNELAISLPRRILIEGSVKNADGTAPSNVQISVTGLTGWSNVGIHTDYASNFAFFVNANEVITVQPINNDRGDSKSGVAPARLNVPVGNGWSAPAPRFDFVLEKGTKVTGKMIAKDTKWDVSKTHIHVYDDAANQMTDMNRLFVLTNRNEQGEFDIQLPDGRYRLKVSQWIDGKEKVIDKPLVINGEEEIRFDLEI